MHISSGVCRPLLVPSTDTLNSRSSLPAGLWFSPGSSSGCSQFRRGDGGTAEDFPSGLHQDAISRLFESGSEEKKEPLPRQEQPRTPAVLSPPRVFKNKIEKYLANPWLLSFLPPQASPTLQREGVESHENIKTREIGDLNQNSHRRVSALPAAVFSRAVENPPHRDLPTPAPRDGQTRTPKSARWPWQRLHPLGWKQRTRRASSFTR